jgi:hypothetical protein
MKKTGMLFTVVLLAVFMGSVAVRGNVQHILWLTNGTTGDVASVYLRMDSQKEVTPTVLDLEGEILLMDIHETFRFLAANWLNTDPNRPCIDMHYWNTFSRYYAGGLKNQAKEPIVVPDPNEPPAPVIPDPEPIITFRIAATTTAGGVYHLPSCRYVTETSRTITIEQAQAYRPCKVCRPDEIDALLAEFLPAATTKHTKSTKKGR